MLRCAGSNTSLFSRKIFIPITVSFNLTFDVNNALRYYIIMIKSFRDRETEKIFNRHFSKKFPSDIQHQTLRKLVMLDAAPELIALRIPPGNKLEALKGGRKGQHSIRINDQWRICFKWKAGDAYDVEITDYH
jgi:proteic killer suppression protein